MASPLPLLSLLSALAALAPDPPPAQDYFPASFATPSVSCRPGSRPQPILTNFQADWYARQLRAAGEPSLARAVSERRAPGVETLRFTWLRTFHHPVVIRIETARGRSHLVAKEMSGRGGYDPGEIARQLDRALSATEARALDALLVRARLFAGTPRNCSFGLDGAQWLFEGVDAGGYHFLDRWSPEDGPAREVGTFLLGLTGWSFDAIY